MCSDPVGQSHSVRHLQSYELEELSRCRERGIDQANPEPGLLLRARAERSVSSKVVRESEDEGRGPETCSES